jgi:hypothetical protein
LQGSHHSAQKSRITGVAIDRSRTVDWKLASVTSMIVSGPPAEKAAGAPSGGLAGPASADGAAGRAGAGRSALRSTAPRVKIDGVLRGSLMVP